RPRTKSDPPVDWKSRVLEWWPPVLLAFLAGTARSANNWLLPACAILLVTAAVLRRGGGRLPPLSEAVRGAISGVLLTLLSLVLWLPYSKSYSLPTQGLGVVTLKTDLIDFLLFWGVLFVPALMGLVPRERPADEAARRRRDLRAALIAGGSLLLALASQTPVLLAVVPLLLVSCAFAWRALKAEVPDPPAVWTGFLLVLSLSIIAGCEFVYFKDSYGVDLQRMNTVFKFYNQAWPLLAVAAAVLAEKVWSEAGRFRQAARAVLAVTVVAALLYPIDAALSRLQMHSGPFTLDASQALTRRSPADAAAIGWLERSAPRNAVVLEASGDPYGEFARISSHTGIPTLLGWSNHESLWRGNEQEISDRATYLKVFYGGDERLANAVVQKYKVTHVVLGDMERKLYPNADLISRYLFLKPEFPGPTTVYSIRKIP
ncbi:MAG TPA: DUF2298 domain-containing protein, partial [Thermoanaerobaculia bacterium]|nr:DUF2298 domain-containing protein [Thermoanaerobaculia bacterium]